MTAPAQTPRLELTRHNLWFAVLQKAKTLPGENTPDGENATAIADAIRLHGLSEALTGLRHDGKPVKFGRAFEIVMGERLTLERGK